MAVHFAANPRRGGIPPRDNRIKIKVSWFILGFSLFNVPIWRKDFVSEIQRFAKRQIEIKA